MSASPLVLTGLDMCPHSPSSLEVTHLSAQVLRHSSVSPETLGTNSCIPYLSPIVRGV